MGFLQNLFGKSDKKNQPADQSTGQPNIPPEFGNRTLNSTPPQPPAGGDSQLPSSGGSTDTSAIPTPTSQPTPDITPPASQDSFAPNVPTPELPEVPGPDAGSELPEIPKVDNAPEEPGSDTPSVDEPTGLPKPAESPTSPETPDLPGAPASPEVPSPIEPPKSTDKSSENTDLN